MYGVGCYILPDPASGEERRLSVWNWGLRPLSFISRDRPGEQTFNGLVDPIPIHIDFNFRVFIGPIPMSHGSSHAYLHLADRGICSAVVSGPLTRASRLLLILCIHLPCTEEFEKQIQVGINQANTAVSMANKVLGSKAAMKIFVILST